MKLEKADLKLEKTDFNFKYLRFQFQICFLISNLFVSISNLLVSISNLLVWSQNRLRFGEYCSFVFFWGGGDIIGLRGLRLFWLWNLVFSPSLNFYVVVFRIWSLVLLCVWIRKNQNKTCSNAKRGRWDVLSSAVFLVV